MTKAQFQKAKAVIEQDAEITQLHYDHSGRTCVIGGLLKFAGFPVQQLQGRSEGIGAIEPAQECLRRHYGFTLGEMRELQEVNDSCGVVTERRERLINKLSQFVEARQ